ncbi:glycosyl hydrolase [Fulvivirga sp. M361]|uniref:glycoside hydrolase family 88/105 protein n=1 Tax=Fulvivirga sp. M361 TaxID=2594266 RepID=UPI00117AF9CA|nr:glycoside hydrolase family 88 protein [Fulvivirga sp. M361]TRX62043.1 glycosyl hydrolase [Fulvivirga sp. M361]
MKVRCVNSSIGRSSKNMQLLSKGIFTLVLVAFAAHVNAQYRKALRTEEGTVRFLADKVLETTSLQLINHKTGENYPDSKGLATSADIKLKSKYVDWHYENGVLKMALIRMSEALNDPKYADHVAETYTYAFDQLDYFQKLYKDPEVKKTSLFRFFKMDMLDNCGTMGAALIETYQVHQDKRFKEYIDKAADYISHREHRLEDGTFVRDHPVEMTLWGDDLYMGCIFLVKMGEMTGEVKYLEDAANQVINFTQYLYNDTDRLYNHAFIIPTKDLTPAYWGRANGWIMMAQVELLSALPRDHPKRAQLLTILRRHIRGIVRYQSGSGRWHQVLDRTDSYEESSCTAMFTYAIARAVNEGWVPDLYRTAAQRGWQGLKEKVTEDAQVSDICVGTHVELNAPFYYNRPRSVNDTHGLASTLLAGVEMHRMNNSQK